MPLNLIYIKTNVPLKIGAGGWSPLHHHGCNQKKDQGAKGRRRGKEKRRRVSQQD